MLYQHKSATVKMDVLTILLVILTLWVIYISQSVLEIWRYLSKAKLLPSRKSFPIFGHSLTLSGPRNGVLERLSGINNENPRLYVLWFGPVPVLTVRQPEHIEVILGSAKYIEKSFHYKFLEPWLGTGLLTSKGFKWHSHRKMLTPAFHFSILENFIEVFSEKSQVLVKKLQKAARYDSIDIFPYISMCSLDIICETAMGVEINAQENGENSEYVTAVQESSSVIMYRMLSPWFFPTFLFNVSSYGRRFKKYLKTLHEFTNQVICERKEMFNLKKESLTSDADNIGKKNRLSFLDLLLTASKSGNVLTDEEIREEVDTFMFEGHDTTAAGISWSLQVLASYPNVQEKVFEEIENIFQGSDRAPTMKDLNDMKYLERVIKETLRLYPSVPLIGRYLREDLHIDGLRIPAGMMVLFQIYFTHRDSQQFPDPEKFNPDNFLPERVAARHPYAYIPFSAGPRNCIGQKFALLEEKTVLSYIVRHYKVEATTHIPKQIPDLILRPDNGVHLKIIPRQVTGIKEF